jgi:wobble nucleotide-excising tRNase
MEQKTEFPGMYKVSEGVLVNKDTEALKAYKKRKMKERKIDALEKDVQDMKSDLQEIKNLLERLVK